MVRHGLKSDFLLQKKGAIQAKVERLRQYLSGKVVEGAQPLQQRFSELLQKSQQNVGRGVRPGSSGQKPPQSSLGEALGGTSPSRGSDGPIRTASSVSSPLKSRIQEKLEHLMSLRRRQFHLGQSSTTHKTNLPYEGVVGLEGGSAQDQKFSASVLGVGAQQEAIPLRQKVQAKLERFIEVKGGHVEQRFVTGAPNNNLEEGFYGSKPIQPPPKQDDLQYGRLFANMPSQAVAYQMAQPTQKESSPTPYQGSVAPKWVSSIDDAKPSSFGVAEAESKPPSTASEEGTMMELGSARGAIAFNPYRYDVSTLLFREPAKKTLSSQAKRLSYEEERMKLERKRRDILKKGIQLTYLFENMSDSFSYSKFKPALQSACKYALQGYWEEGLNLFRVITEQKIPDEYKRMVETNIADIEKVLNALYLVEKPTKKNDALGLEASPT